MFEISIPHTNSEKQRKLVWKGTPELFTVICHALRDQGFDLKSTFPIGSATGRYVWLPKDRSSKLTWKNMEETIRRIVQEYTEQFVPVAIDYDRVQQWLLGMHQWIGTLNPRTAKVPVMPLFEIDRLIARGELNQADKLLQHRSASETDSDKMMEILRSQMFLKFRQRQWSGIWDLYLKWKKYPRASLDAIMSYWISKAAIKEKQFECAFELLKELQQSSLEKFSKDEQIDIRIMLIKMLNRQNEWAEVLFRCRDIFSEVLSDEQRLEVIRVSADAFEELMGDDQEPYLNYFRELPEGLQDHLKDELDLDEGFAEWPEDLVPLMDTGCDQDAVEELLHRWSTEYMEKPLATVHWLKKEIEKKNHPRLVLALARTYVEAMNELGEAARFTEHLDPDLLDREERLVLYKLRMINDWKQDRIDAAMEWAKHCILVNNQDDPEVNAIYGMLALQIGNRDAKEYLALAIEQGIDQADVYKAYGVTLVNDDPEKASLQFKKALRLDPTHEESLEWLSLVENDDQSVLSALKGYFQALTKGFWDKNRFEKYRDRLECARRVNDMYEGEKQEDLVEAYMDFLEYHLRQEEVDCVVVTDLLKQAIRELKAGTDCLEVVSTLEIVLDPHADEVARASYWDLADRFLRRRDELFLVDSVLRRMIVLDTDESIIDQIRIELNRNRSMLKEGAMSEDVADVCMDMQVDLSHLCVAVVSGYESVRRRICEILKERFRIEKFREVPPSFEASNDAKVMEEKIRPADVILYMYRCSKHSDAYALNKALESVGSHKLAYVAGKGHSSAIAAFEKFIISEGMIS